MSTPPAARRRLWLKLAIFGTLGVVVTHSLHLVVANTVTAHALEEQIAQRGRTLVELVARQSVNAVLTRHLTELQELVDTTAADPSVTYCFIAEGERVIASSFARGTPAGLVALRRGRGRDPVIVRSDTHRTLDLTNPIARTAAEVRLGMSLDAFPPVRRRLATTLGLLALAVIGLGALAAFVVGRRIGRPVDAMVAALQTTDPARVPTPLAIPGRDEIALLAGEVDRMRERLHHAFREQERARRRQLQTEKLASLGQLVAGVAHEINNPLAGIKNCQRRLLREGLGEEKRREYLELIGEGLARVEEIVGGLLDYARVRTPRLAAVELRALAESAIALVRAGRPRREEIVLHEPPTRIVVVVDGPQIVQAIVNLLLNAVHVTPAGGSVEVSLRAEVGRAAVVVRDQGPGIPEAIRSQVEDPFFTTKPEGEGTGLGLSVTRGIAAAHGGDLTYEFPGRGTIVSLWLPLDAGAVNP